MLYWGVFKGICYESVHLRLNTEGKTSMATPVEIVQQLNQAFMEKNETVVRERLHPQFTGRCPLASVNGRDEALEMMKKCPFVWHIENSVFVAEGDSVVQLFDWVVESPFQGRFRTARYVTLENGLVRSAEMFYDTSALPREVLDQLKQMCPTAATACERR